MLKKTDKFLRSKISGNYFKLTPPNLLAIMPISQQGEMVVKKQTKERMDLQANVFKALAHFSRIFIVNELAKGKKCVCELTEMIGADKSTVSKHLSVLKQAGIVSDTKDGNKVFYSLEVKCVLNFISCIDGMIEANIKKMEIYIK